MGEFDDESGNESGSSLRKQLEAALRQNKELAGELRTFKAKDLVAEKGFTFVKAEDLADVDLADLPTKAAELEEAKRSTRVEVLKDVLREQGTAEDELDSAVERFLAPKEETPHEVSTRLAGLGNIKGKAVDTSTEGLTGPDLIFAAVKD